MSGFVMVYVTVSSKVEAERIARVLLEEHLVACVNVIGLVSSFFYWEGKIDSAEECLMIMKTDACLFADLEVRVRALHSYAVPEILAVPVVAGSGGYFDWMRSVLKR